MPTGSFLVILASFSHEYSFWASLIGGICSVVSIAITLYSKDMDLKDKEKQRRHFEVSNKLWSIREDYVSLLTDLEYLDISDILVKRDQLKSLVAKIYEEAPITDNASYEASRKALKYREAQFFTREEKNQILPQHLRY